MATGQGMVKAALEHLGEQYILGAVAPKNDPAWDGPWDCAEFVSWCVYQTARILYGCYDNQANPATADAYTGFWGRDAKRIGKQISVAAAARIAGAAVLRLGPKIGHIVISDGRGWHRGGPFLQHRGHSPHLERPPVEHGYSRSRRQL